MDNYLNELDANKLLSSYKIPMAKSFLCKNVDEAVSNARYLKFPVVMKILSSDILHKTDAGCVFVDVKNKDELSVTFYEILENAKKYNSDAKIEGILIQEMAEKGLEMIIGMKYDQQFGPTIMVGSGGIYVEVYKDVSLRLLPIKRIDAEKMLKEIKISNVLKGLRGKIYDDEAIIDVLLKVSKMCLENPSIKEIDINPLFVYEKGMGAKGVDALIKITI